MGMFPSSMIIKNVTAHCTEFLAYIQTKIDFSLFCHLSSNFSCYLLVHRKVSQSVLKLQHNIEVNRSFIEKYIEAEVNN